jgi:peptide/nickel transport system ATP-binding protein
MIDSLSGERTILDISDLKMHFPVKRNLLGHVTKSVKAVDGVSLAVRAGETVGLVGESGCGKTTLGRCIIRTYQPSGGHIFYRPDDGAQVDLAQLKRQELMPYRRQIRMTFQDPYSSLNPRMTVLDIVGEPLRIHGMAKGKALEERVAALLQRVGLRPEYMRRYPHAFSGGQRQRIGLARALATDPHLIVADEAVSALDVSVRAQVLKLMQALQRDFHLTYLFISHDLSVVEYIADRVAVMYVGKLVEVANTGELYHQPKHPYTEALLSAVPKPDPRLRSQRIILQGDIPDPSNPPSGCYFHPRCRYAQERCSTETPHLHDTGRGHIVACHFAEELALHGVPHRPRQAGQEVS